MVKIVHELGKKGYLKTRQGVGGGFTLATPAKEIALGEVVRSAEKRESVIECVDKAGCMCRLLPACRLKVALDEAAAAFYRVLDSYTIADLVRQPNRLRALLGMQGPN